MACRPALEAQDSWLSGLFQVPVTVRTDGPGLVVTSGTTQVVLGPEDEPSVVLEGTRWTLESLGGPGGDDATVSSVPAGVRAGLQIDDGVLRLDSGCNTGSGSVAVGEESLEVGDLAMTLLGCSGDRADVEAQVLAVVHGTVGFALAGDRLTLTGEDGSTLGFRPADLTPATPQPADLEGQEWHLVGIVRRDGEVVSTSALPDQLVATVRVQDGQLLVNTGCNVGSAPVSVSARTLEAGRLMLTKRACRVEDGEVEGAIVTLLESGAVRWSIADGRLTLSARDGTLELTYAAG
ncbi:MAG: META domain-containing protein, partial [Nocardioides sp.]